MQKINKKAITTEVIFKVACVYLRNVETYFYNPSC